MLPGAGRCPGGEAFREESALCAAPIVAYDLDWQGDLIRTGKTGELVPYREPVAMAEAVLRLLELPEYARSMGRGARDHALELLDPKRLNDHERAEYAKLLRASGSGAEARAD